MKKQKSDMASRVMMVRPAAFAFNPLTAVTNSYQPGADIFGGENIHKQAVNEFNKFVQLLDNSGVETLIFNDSLIPRKPDAMFPNNWISTHSDGTIALYPMCAKNRRTERRNEFIDQLTSVFKVNKIIDLSHSLAPDERNTSNQW